jgi:hypothetical protein
LPDVAMIAPTDTTAIGACPDRALKWYIYHSWLPDMVVNVKKIHMKIVQRHDSI